MKLVFISIFSLIFGLIIVLGGLFAPVVAQSEPPTLTPIPTREATPTAEPEPPTDQEPEAEPTDENGEIPLIHVVQEGETLFSIAELYETTIEVLQQLNDISDPALLFIGQELTIPGGGGDVVATVHVVQVGDTLESLAAEFGTTDEAIAAENRLVKADYLVAGESVNILSRTGSAEPQPVLGRSHVVQAGDTLLTLAAAYDVSPAEIVRLNGLAYPTYLYPGQPLRLPAEGNYQALPAGWQQVRVYPVPAVQGETIAVYVQPVTGTVDFPAGSVPVGHFADQGLHFAAFEDGYVALVGLDAFTEPGRYALDLEPGLSEGQAAFSQEILVVSGNYGTQYITIPAELNGLLDPEVRAADEARLAQAFSHFSEQPSWTGLYQQPVTNTVITAGYGDARSYNEGPIEIFHTGVDFSGAVGTPIYAPAAGTVVFSDTLVLFGSSLVLDHGLGVQTAYYHLSKVHVASGDSVSAGQLIADGGSTGLSSGPHLHWDLRVHNVPVNGLQWTREDLLLAVLPRLPGGEPGSGP